MMTGWPRTRLLRLHGMTKTAADRAREGYSHWDMVVLGWKYNMDNIQAAILLPQIDRLGSNWQRRHALVDRYRDGLATIPGVTGPKTHSNTKHAHHLLPIWIESRQRDEVIVELQRQGIGVVVNYRAIHELTYFVSTSPTAVAIFLMPSGSATKPYHSPSIQLCPSNM